MRALKMSVRKSGPSETNRSFGSHLRPKVRMRDQVGVISHHGSRKGEDGGWHHKDR